MTRAIQAIGLSVKRLQMRHHRALDAGLVPIGITLVQWDALRHLDENPGASLHDLALLTFQSDQSFGALANRMVDRGLVRRVAGEGRAILHHLTPEGEAMLQAGNAVADRVLAGSFAPRNQAARPRPRFGL